jgi:hypothetical protein
MERTEKIALIVDLQMYNILHLNYDDCSVAHVQASSLLLLFSYVSYADPHIRRSRPCFNLTIYESV